MPIYEYRCEHCGLETEIEQSIKDSAIEDCPICGHSSFTRLISRTLGFVRREATTIGQLAEKNSKIMGKYKIDELSRERSEKMEKPYAYINNDKYKKFQKMTPAQRNKYILEGE